MRKVIRSQPGPDALALPPAGAPAAATSSPAAAELAAAYAHYNALLAPGAVRTVYEFEVYTRKDVKAALYRDFYDKCAYCESRYATTAPVDVEHYRPKGRVKGDKTHPGYWWLAMRWENLLPACIFCNRHNEHATPTPPKPSKKASAAQALALDPLTGKFNSSLMLTTGKQDAFPVKNARLLPQSQNYASEDPLLLDPCTDDPELHLHFHIDKDAPLGLVLPKALAGQTTLDHLTPVKESKKLTNILNHAANFQLSERGAVSIQTYGLNRLQLVRERTRILHRLEFLGDMVIKIANLVQELRAPSGHPLCQDRMERAADSLTTMQDMVIKEILAMTDASAPYSVMAQAWLKHYKARIGGAPTGTIP